MPPDTYTLVIADAGVSTPANLSVTTGKIVNLAVTTAKLENYTTAGTGVTTVKIDNGAVTTDKLETSSSTITGVTTAKIAAGAVTDVKLATDAVTTGKIANFNVTTAKLENYTTAGTGVTTVKIDNGAVTSAKIAALTITDGNIASGAAIALSKLATGALPAGITVATAAACSGNAATATSLAGGSTGAIAYQTGGSNTGFSPVGAAGHLLQSNGAAAPSWVSPTNTVASGGTGLTSYTTGDILYANTPSTLAKLPAAAAGNVLLSGTTPSYGQVPLATHVSGTLPVINGGTGAATLTGYVKASGTAVMTAIATIPVADGGTGSTTGVTTGLVGYATGEAVGAAVTQLISRTSDTPPINKATGAITVYTVAPTAVGAYFSFTVPNNTIAETDTVVLSVRGATNTYVASVSSIIDATSFKISMVSVVGTASDAPIVNFAIIKASSD